MSQFYAHLIGFKKRGPHRALPSTWGSNASIVAVETFSRVREFEAGGALDGDKYTVYGRQHSHSLMSAGPAALASALLATLALSLAS